MRHKAWRIPGPQALANLWAPTLPRNVTPLPPSEHGHALVAPPLTPHFSKITTNTPRELGPLRVTSRALRLALLAPMSRARGVRAQGVNVKDPGATGEPTHGVALVTWRHPRHVLGPPAFGVGPDAYPSLPRNVTPLPPTVLGHALVAPPHTPHFSKITTNTPRELGPLRVTSRALRLALLAPMSRARGVRAQGVNVEGPGCHWGAHARRGARDVAPPEACSRTPSLWRRPRRLSLAPTKRDSTATMQCSATHSWRPLSPHISARSRRTHHESWDPCESRAAL